MYQLSRRQPQRPLFAHILVIVRVDVVCGFYASFILLISTYLNVLIDKLLLKL